MKYDYDAGFTPERPEERELAGALDRFSAECMEHGGDAGGPYLTNQDGVEQAGREVAAAVTALLARADHIGDAADMIPLALEQLREMDGSPAYWAEDDSWGIISVDSAGPWAGMPFFRGRKFGVNFEYDIESREIEVYAYTPTASTRKFWTAEWRRQYKSGIHAGNGYVCSGCDMWNNRPSWFCPSCGKAMTPEAWAELEKRVRG
ncbi:hypothetical protein B5E80_18865 [Flavonifractor sp. An135]|nr:hypothetical protein [Flavonifractor sp. An135]OUQ16778.1 hypothetical protein B5E80_18865 [Flavonifractor sp. An135]